jgi:hypothetical protein
MASDLSASATRGISTPYVRSDLTVNGAYVPPDEPAAPGLLTQAARLAWTAFMPVSRIMGAMLSHLIEAINKTDRASWRARDNSTAKQERD